MAVQSAALTRTQAVPPGPSGHWLFGVMPEYNRDPYGFLARIRHEFGDVVSARFLHVTVYFLFHPDQIEEVLVTKSRRFQKHAALRTRFFSRIAGQGLITSEGEFWRRQRRLAQPAFHRQRVQAYGEVMVEYAERLMAEWRAGETRDLHHEMSRLTLQIVVKTLFGAEAGRDGDEVGELFAQVSAPFADIATIKWMIDNRLPTPTNRRFHRAMTRLDEILFRIISERRADNTDHGDLLWMLLAAQDADGSQMTDRQLRDEAMTLFLAGHETTALALTWTWYLLAQHPRIEEKLLAELKAVLNGRAPTIDDVPKLRYTEAVLKEAMRLYPPAWGMGRQAVEDCEIGGWQIPKGRQLFMYQWLTHRDPRFFPQPDEFNPDRWTDEFTRNLPRFAYFPFGGGPRVCIGQSFAMMEATLIIAAMAQRFHFVLLPNQSITPFPAITLRPKQGVHVRLAPREP